MYIHPDDVGLYREAGFVVDDPRDVRPRRVLRSEFELTVQNPESLRDLGRALNARSWAGSPENLPAGARDVYLMEAPRPLNRAGRRAQRRQK